MKPKQIVIETSSRCNLRCTGCYRNHGTPGNQNMDFYLFKDIIDRVYWGATIVLFWNGEPLLNPDFLKMLTYTTEKGLRCYFCTNGTIWNPDVFLHAVNENSCYQVFFSLDGFCMQNDLLRPGSSAVEIEDRIWDVVDMRNWDGDKGTSIGIKLIDRGQDRQTIEEFIDKWIHIVDLVVIGKYWDQNLSVPTGVRFNPCLYAAGMYMVIDSKGKVHLCEHNMRAPIVGDVTGDVDLEFLYDRNVATWDTKKTEPCSTCPMSYTGGKIYGTVNVKGYNVFFQQDYYNTIYSLKDKKEGVLWSTISDPSN